jgi:hypothetical protein
MVRVSRGRGDTRSQSVPRLRQRLQCVLVRLEFTETLRELQVVRTYYSSFCRHVPPLCAMVDAGLVRVHHHQRATHRTSTAWGRCATKC